MAKETQIGKLVIELQAKTEGLESSLKVAQNKLKEIEESNKKVENSNKSVDASWIAVAGTATAALMGIKGAISAAVDEYKSYTQAMESLSDVSDYTNQNMKDMTKVMNKYSSIMNKSDIATTIKNFSLMGMTVEETDKMIESLTNSAIRNRNANYTVSEAVRIASEGYRQGLSTLSDSAGVTENLSVMLDNYAASIGKTASKLTEAEKNQAYLNRTMYAAEPFAGAMEGYLDSLAGKQGLYAQSMRETQVAFAEALEPTMSMLLSVGAQILEMINNLIASNPSMTAGVTAFAITLSALILIIVSVKKAIDTYKNSAIAAKVATDGFTAAILSNPLGIIVAAISMAVAAFATYTTAVKEHEEAQKKLVDTQNEYNSALNKTLELSESNASSIQEKRDAIQDYIDMMGQLNTYNSQINVLDNIKSNLENNGQEGSEEYGIVTERIETLQTLMKGLQTDIQDASNELEKLYGLDAGDSLVLDKSLEIEQLQKYLEVYNEYIDDMEASRNIKKKINTETLKNEQKEAAQQVITSNNMQKYLNLLNTADKDSQEYKKAIQELTNAYPEAANASGINKEAVQDLINEQKAEAEQAWRTSQANIQANIQSLNSFLEMTIAAEGNAERQAELANLIGISYENIVPTLQSVINTLNGMANYIPENVPGIKPTILEDKINTTPSGSSSYSNEALDNYKKQIEHKKALDQLTLKEEISMYETALREYANTADEKMELREKIYELNKELAKKEKEMLEQQTEDYENYIQEQKNLRGAAYDVVEQTRDYDKIIRMHKSYLDQIMEDERLSLEERKEIYREELEVIRDYEQQKRDLRVEAVDNTVSQLTNAITKQLEEAQKKDKEAIDKNLEEVEKWKNARIDAINEEYDARIEAINKELDALNKVEEQKSREEEDAEFEKKKLRLEQLIAYEHDATNRANYQKELDKLVADYQKTLDDRALQDKKDALNEQKELLQKEQDEMTQAVEEEADKQVEVYNKQLKDLEKYYEKQIDMAQETAEKMLLNVGQNQDKILNLLKSYGDKYEITGQTLGEKLAQGINNGLSDKIQNIVQKIQDTIDANLNSKIKEWTASNYKYEEGQGKPVTQNITVNQTNNIEQLPELPSETYRKLNNISENLAAELSGV